MVYTNERIFCSECPTVGYIRADSIIDVLSCTDFTWCISKCHYVLDDVNTSPDKHHASETWTFLQQLQLLVYILYILERFFNKRKHSRCNGVEGQNSWCNYIEKSYTHIWQQWNNSQRYVMYYVEMKHIFFHVHRFDVAEKYLPSNV